MFATKKRIAGSEGTHNYVVIEQSKIGLVAVRRLQNGSYRVRVEPSDNEAATILAKKLQRNIFVDPSWKQPYDQEHGQNRFSTVVNGEDELHTAVQLAVKALHQFDTAAADSSDWEAALTAVAEVGSTDRNELIARLRQNGTPGANSASRWTTTTLVEKALVEKAFGRAAA